LAALNFCRLLKAFLSYARGRPNICTFEQDTKASLFPSLFHKFPNAASAFYPSHCVRTATPVDPRVTAPESLNRTKIRFAAGSKGTLPLPCTKIPKVGIALALIVVVTVLPIPEIH
jgi:hypothetical protein